MHEMDLRIYTDTYTLMLMCNRKKGEGGEGRENWPIRVLHLANDKPSNFMGVFGHQLLCVCSIYNYTCIYIHACPTQKSTIFLGVHTAHTERRTEGKRQIKVVCSDVCFDCQKMLVFPLFVVLVRS